MSLKVSESFLLRNSGMFGFEVGDYLNRLEVSYHQRFKGRRESKCYGKMLQRGVECNEDVTLSSRLLYLYR